MFLDQGPAFDAACHSFHFGVYAKLALIKYMCGSRTERFAWPAGKQIAL
jgi:hypothetical protein